MHWSKEMLLVYSRFKSKGKSVHSHMYECSQKRVFPKQAWDALAELGFMSAMVDHGPEKGLEWMAAALNGFTEGCQDGGFAISPICHAAMGVRVVNEHGSERLKSKYLEGVCSGKKVIAFACTEANQGGTDAYNPSTTLTVSKNGNFLNGAKWHITNAGSADLLMVIAKDSDTGKLALVMVERGFAGVSVGEECQPGGARTSPVAPFELNNVKVPEENIIHIPHCMRYLTSVLVAERVLSAFPSLGLMRLCISKCFAFTRERRVDGYERLVDKQNIKSSLSEMDMTYELTLAYAKRALSSFGSNNRSVIKESSVLKVMHVRNLISVVLEAIQVCASYGLQDEAQLCQSLLDAVSVTAGGGTEYAHKEIIFSHLKREHKETDTLWVSGDTPWVPQAQPKPEEIAVALPRGPSGGVIPQPSDISAAFMAPQRERAI